MQGNIRKDISKIAMMANTSQGMYRYRKELIEQFVKRGISVHLLSEFNGCEEELKKMGSTLVELKVDRRGTSILKDIRLLYKYYKTLKQKQIQAILTYHIKPNIYAGILARILGLEYYPNITGLGTAVLTPGILQKWVLFLYRIALKGATCVFFENSDNRRYLIENKLVSEKQRYRIMPGEGVNIEDFLPLPYPSKNKSINFLFAGRIMKDKGVHELLEAFKLVKRQYQNVELHIIGSFDEDYRDIINSSVESGLIKYYGYQENVKPFLEKAHAAVLPSYHEGMSNSLLEAAASARPIIASNIPGCKEIFDDGVTGFACETRDVDTLVEAMLNFISLSHEEKVKMGLRARKKIEKEFDRRFVVKGYLEEVLGASKEWVK